MLNRLSFFSVWLFLIVAVSQQLIWAQNYNFTNYNLKEGLPQSQVSVIFQAKDCTLWLGSFGGVSNFDGINFKSYSKADGLLSNNVSCITEDRQNRIWVGTDNGINVIQNDKIYKILEGVDVYSLIQDSEGNIWGLSNRRLFRLQNNKIRFVDIVEGEIVTCLNKDSKGNLYVFIRRVGVFRLTKNKWQSYAIFPAGVANNYVNKLLFDDKGNDKFYFSTLKNGVFTSENGKIDLLFHHKSVDGYFDLAQDVDRNIWIATQKGVFLVNSKGSVVLFNEKNGLKTNRINVVFKDVEGNIWLSSFADGIFRYDGDAFIKYDTFKGRDLSYSISGMAVDKDGKLWVSTFSEGLYRFDGENLSQPEARKLKDKFLYFVTTDSNRNIILSVQNNGLWKYNGSTFSQMPFTQGANISAVIQDEQDNFYVGEVSTVAYLTKNKVEKISGFKGWVSCLYYYKKDSVILGTSSGVYLIKNKKIDVQFKVDGLENAYIVGITKHRQLLLFFTLGDGIISFDTHTGKTKRYLRINGLSSNDVYSIAIDKNDILWVGTGRGINKLKFDTASQGYKVIKGNSPVVESNQNAIVNYQSSVLVGTTTGILLCNTNLLKREVVPPSISLKGMNVFDKVEKDRDTLVALSKEKSRTIILKHTQNHISIRYKGVSLSNPQNVVYRYCLLGVDADFGKPVASTEAEYSALSPGTYTFKVYAEVNEVRSSIKEITFVIKPPFYATSWFKAITFVTLVLASWLLFSVILKRKERIRRQREKIKLEEQAKIRKQTAEDFHDDIGNKLTRINVLSEILDKKINEQQTEQKELIRMIKQNAGFLYTGTKDVLWALDPKSDNLYEIMQHIRNFGTDLFQKTDVFFQMEEPADKYRKWHMSMEQNRNLTLIFKEVLTNILKHAKASSVRVDVFEDEAKTIKIQVEDDGIGFNLDNIKHGQGLKNIKNRCERINLVIDVHTGLQQGTNVSISGIKPLDK